MLHVQSVFKSYTTPQGPLSVLQGVDLHLEQGGNPSFAMEFGKIVARLDLLTQILDKRHRRLGPNYAQSLPLMNSLPVQ